MVRIDMTEYMEKFSVSRLIGAPPGYVGYDEGSQLTEAVRRKPYSVVLFDEVEKAHPDVFNILLQILDDGRITDSQGRTVDFKNTIIILTSNLGSQYLLDGIMPDGSISDAAQSGIMGELRRTFRPEFLNRLDEIILFRPLTKENLSGIIDNLVGSLRQRLANKTLKLEITPAAKELVIEQGFDPVYGARPLKRFCRVGWKHSSPAQFCPAISPPAPPRSGRRKRRAEMHNKEIRPQTIKQRPSFSQKNGLAAFLFTSAYPRSWLDCWWPRRDRQRAGSHSGPRRLRKG